MLTLPDPKHEAFAVLRASGHDVAAAYIHAGYSVKNVKSRARKLVRNPNIQARIAHLQTCLPRIAELHEYHCPTIHLMPETRHEMLAWLWQVMSGARLVKPAQMRAAGLYCRLQGWHLAKLLPQAQAQAGCPTPDAADTPPVPSSTLTEAEKLFLASSNHQNIAHERSPMPRSPENLARYQSTLADLAHPGCRLDTFSRPLPDQISKSTPATPPAPASPVSSALSTNPSIHSSPINPPANPAILSKKPIPESPTQSPSQLTLPQRLNLIPSPTPHTFLSPSVSSQFCRPAKAPFLPSRSLNKRRSLALGGQRKAR